MSNRKNSIGNLICIFITTAVSAAGIILSRYIPAVIFDESRTLAHTPVIFQMVIWYMVYDFICIIMLIVITVAACVSLVRKAGKKVIAVYALAAIVILGSLLYVPWVTVPWYRYQFAGFIDGVKQNVDEKRLKEWLDDAVSKIDAGGGKTFERGEINFLSSTGIMECETYIEKNNDGTYMVTMHWGDPVGHYGLFVGTDKKAVNNMFEECQTVEIYDGIYAWTDK